MQSDPRNARPARRMPTPVQLAFVLIAASGMAASAQNGPVRGAQKNADQLGAGQVKAVTADAVARAERVVAPIGNGAGLPLRAENPNAFATRAWNTTGLPRSQWYASPAYTLYGETIIIAESRDDVIAALGPVQAEFGWLNPNMIIEPENLEGVFVIDARTVRNALRIAELLRSQPRIADASINIEEPKRSRGGGGDPALSEQWHIENTDLPGNDHGIAAVHAQDVTGKGVVVGILEANRGNITSPYDPDDLADPDFDFSTVVHPDLFPNLRLELSQVTDPFQVDVTHETAVSGIVASTANNGAFGRGVAFDAGLAALRNGSTLERADAFTHQLNSVHIVNNSWGPANVTFPAAGPSGLTPIGPDPEDVEVFFPEVRRVVPSTVVGLAQQQALNLGRNRKGRVFVFSSGNENHFQGWDRFQIGNAMSLPQFGLLDVVTDTFAPGNPFDFFDLGGADAEGWRYSGMMGDRVDYWPIATRPNVIAIGAVGETNQLAGYSTTGSALFASTYSLGVELPRAFGPTGYVGSTVGRGITTTNQIGEGSDGECPGPLQIDGLTCSFSGTSAAAPIASGIIALMLEANPDLTTRDIQHIIQRTSVPLNFDPVGSYWTTLFGYGQPDPDAGPDTPPTFWQVNSAGVIHSDEYGFGLIDAEAAVDLARDWSGLPRLLALDSGVFETGGVTVPDAEFEEVGADEDNNRVFNVLIPGASVEIGRTLPSEVTIPGMACVRENFRVEGVEVTLTIEGIGAGDLFIVLESPRGSVSPLAVPRSDSSFVQTGDGEFAYSEYTFTTYKHWGELSSGTWRLALQDFRPDTESPIGTAPTDDDPGEEQITYLGPLGMPGASELDHGQKTVVSARLRIFGTETGLPPNLACPPILTSCPGDLNADGVIDTVDLQLFFEWYLNSDLRADLTGDGVLNFNDVIAYRAIWIPGFCDRTGLPNGRPVGPSNPSPNNPVVRPI